LTLEPIGLVCGRAFRISSIAFVPFFLRASFYHWLKRIQLISGRT
jgi:hypothetical protein